MIYKIYESPRKIVFTCLHVYVCVHQFQISLETTGGEMLNTMELYFKGKYQCSYI